MKTPPTVAPDEDDALIEYPEFRPYLLGVVEAFGRPSVLCYDRSAVLDHLARDIGDYDDAEEYFYFNVIGTYAGPGTPVFLDRSLAAAFCGSPPGPDGSGADS